MRDEIGRVPPDVAVLGTGGTIASTAAAGGAVPELTTDDLLSAVPEIAEYADVRADQVAQVSSFDMDFETLADVAQTVRTVVADGVDGVVIPHGTDTMEESAYYLDLTLDLDVPVVLTGAQRRPDEISPDGPANLLLAIRAASHGDFRGAGGIYVAFSEAVHAARDVTKVHTSEVDAFDSPNAGPVAAFGRSGMQLFREPGSRSPTIPVDRPETVVRMVKTGIGVDGHQIDCALEDNADGIVVEATGLGNTTGAISDAVATGVDHIPVVVTSRCVAGATAPVYGGPGGGESLREHGAIFGGDLPAHKARIKLLLALEETSDETEIREYFETA